MLAVDAPVLCIASPDRVVCRRAARALAVEGGEVSVAATLEELVACAVAGARLALVDPALQGLAAERQLTRLRAMPGLHGLGIVLLGPADVAALRGARIDTALFSLVRRVQRQAAQDLWIELLGDATRRLTAVPEMRATSRALLDLVAAHLELDTATLFILDGGGRLEARAALGYQLDLQQLRTFPIGEGIAGWVGAARQPTIVGDSDLDGRFAQAGALASRSMLAVPLLMGTTLIGVLTLVRRPPREPFIDADLQLVSALSAPAATALENARLAEHEHMLSARLREVEATLGREREILRRLDAYERTYTQVVSTVSHELKTPLMGISGFAQLLAEGRVDGEEARDSAREIHQNALRLTAYVEEMLDEDQANAGQVRLRLQAIDMAALVRGVVHSLEAGISPRHRLTSVAARGLPPVAGDPERLRQVVVNLVGNAVKYSPGGGTVRITARSSGEEVLLSVVDQGIGIPVPERERVFDRFYRVDGDATRGIRGSGLGLGLVRQLVDLHGGRVWVEDGPGGRGTAMRVALPRMVATEAAITSATAPPSGGRDAPAPAPLQARHVPRAIH